MNNYIFITHININIENIRQFVVDSNGQYEEGNLFFYVDNIKDFFYHNNYTYINNKICDWLAENFAEVILENLFAHQEQGWYIKKLCKIDAGQYVVQFLDFNARSVLQDFCIGLQNALKEFCRHTLKQEFDMQISHKIIPICGKKITITN